VSNCVREYVDGGMTDRSTASGASGTESQSQVSRASRHSDASRLTAGSATTMSHVDDDLHSLGGESTLSNRTAGAYHRRSAMWKMIDVAMAKREELQVMMLCSACASGDVSVVRNLLRTKTFSVNARDPSGRRPLHLAAASGSVEVIALLLASQADVTAVDADGNTALEDALENHKLEAVDFLLLHNGTRKMDGLADRICSLASLAGDTAAIKRLRTLLVGLDGVVPTHNQDGRTALHVAASHNNVEAIPILLDEAQVDVNAPDPTGMTALQVAFHSGHDECSKVLLERGAVMGTFAAGDAMCKAAAGDDVALLRRLLQHKCDINAENRNKRRALHLAASCGNIAAACFLVEQPGIEMDAEDMFGNTALDDSYREQGDGVSVVQRLLEMHECCRGSHVIAAVSKLELASERRAAQETLAMRHMREILQCGQSDLAMGSWRARSCPNSPCADTIFQGSSTCEQ